MKFYADRVRLGQFAGWIAAVLILVNGAAWAKTIYVKAGAPASGDGTSWAKAYPSLQTGLGAATAGDEIWVAAGTYKPTTGAERIISFQMKDGVALYGGFAGTETSRAQRNWTANETILSGDLETTKSYHVVLGANGGLDGFTVTGGYANGKGHTYGGGMYNVNVHPIVANCNFVNNDASYDAGGAYNSDSHTTFTSCSFIGNTATALHDGTAVDCKFFNNRAYDGGAMEYGNAFNCEFTSNTVDNSGGATYRTAAADCTFTSNTAKSGGAMFDGRATRCHFIGNKATSGGAMYRVEATSCTVTRNRASYGGGFYFYDEYNPGSATGCKFINNKAGNGGAIYGGRAINCEITSNSAICGGGICLGSAANCNFTSNTALYGGGMYGTHYPAPETTGSTFRNNIAREEGGGIYRVKATGCLFIGNKAYGGGGMAESTAVNCVVLRNSARYGGGCLSGEYLVNCTIVENDATFAGGVVASDSTRLMNCVVWDNTATTDSQVEPWYMSYFYNCDIQDCGGSGSGWRLSPRVDKGGNISADPQFVDAANPTGPDGIWLTADDGLRLRDGSPCINAGYSTAPGSYMPAVPLTDILGNPRVNHARDIGAYENQTALSLPQVVVYDGANPVYGQDSSLFMGTVMIGSVPLTRTFTIKNIGTEDLVTSSVKTAVPFRIVKAPAARLAPGTSTTMIVAMDTNTSGSKTVDVSFATNDPAFRIFQFSLYGRVITPVLEVMDENRRVVANGATVKVRSCRVGAAAPGLKFTLHNLGDATMTLGRPTIGAPFQFTSAPRSPLGIGATTNIAIAMNTSTSGTYSQTLTIPTNDPKNAPYSITVNGVVQAEPKVLYVKPDSTATTKTANLGASWATAYPDLQPALAAARPGNEIRVAAGTYKPTRGTDRSTSFGLPMDVALYGGFAGTETTLARDWKSHPSILSGEIGTSATTDNSYHVVAGAHLGTLDGFTIRGGYASNPGDERGGGMINIRVSPAINNCTFVNNVAKSDQGAALGGAMCNVNASPDFVNCVFQDNVARGGTGYSGGIGGAIYNQAGSQILVNCVFINNSAVSDNSSVFNRGGAIFESATSLGRYRDDPGRITLTNCTFTSNSTVAYSSGKPVQANGSALYLFFSSGVLTGSIFWNNTIYMEDGSLQQQTLTLAYCDIQKKVGSIYGVTKVIDAGGNITADPKFLDVSNPAGRDGIWRTGDDGLMLRSGSTCVDAGTPTATPPMDITGRIRMYRNDMGAYESPYRNAAGAWVMYQ